MINVLTHVSSSSSLLSVVQFASIHAATETILVHVCVGFFESSIAIGK